MYGLWLTLVFYYRKVRDKTWGPLWTKFLNIAVHDEVVFDEACHYLEKAKTNNDKDGSRSKLRHPLFIGIAGAVVGSIVTALLTYCFNPSK